MHDNRRNTPEWNAILRQVLQRGRLAANPGERRTWHSFVQSLLIHLENLDELPAISGVQPGFDGTWFLVRLEIGLLGHRIDGPTDPADSFGQWWIFDPAGKRARIAPRARRTGDHVADHPTAHPTPHNAL